MTCDPQLCTYCRLSPRSQSHNFLVARVRQGTFDWSGNRITDLSKLSKCSPITEFPDPNAHIHAHSAVTVKFARPHCDSTYWPKKPIFLKLKIYHVFGISKIISPWGYHVIIWCCALIQQLPLYFGSWSKSWPYRILCLGQQTFGKWSLILNCYFPPRFY